MKGQAEEIRAFILENIPAHQKDIVAVTAGKFSVSRTTVHRHLSRLARDKKIIRTGTTNKAVYSLFSSRNKTIIINIKPPSAEEDKIWSDNFQQDFISLDKNVFEICEYGFTEILNNAIEHSEGKCVQIETAWSDDSVEIRITDDGIGIFKKIKTEMNFSDERESIIHLSKGKLTTDPQGHTGEGIFFASKAFDEFNISANSLIYARFSQENDWLMESRKDMNEKGTAVSMKIAFHGNRTLKQIFDSYTNPETFKFDKTRIVVNLSKFEEERYISRSQARRLLWGIEKFHEVILDFKNVTTVGQGFVDEVFRVFKNKHPDIKIVPVNANDDVKFMIERGLSYSD